MKFILTLAIGLFVIYVAKSGPITKKQRDKIRREAEKYTNDRLKNMKPSSRDETIKFAKKNKNIFGDTWKYL